MKFVSVKDRWSAKSCKQLTIFVALSTTNGKIWKGQDEDGSKKEWPKSSWVIIFLKSSIETYFSCRPLPRHFRRKHVGCTPWTWIVLDRRTSMLVLKWKSGRVSSSFWRAPYLGRSRQWSFSQLFTSPKHHETWSGEGGKAGPWELFGRWGATCVNKHVSTAVDLNDSKPRFRFHTTPDRLCPLYFWAFQFSHLSLPITKNGWVPGQC